MKSKEIQMARARSKEYLNADTAITDNLPSDLEVVLDDEAAPGGPSSETTARSLRTTSGFASASSTAPVTAS